MERCLDVGRVAIEEKVDGFRFSRINGKWMSKQGKSLFNVKEIQTFLNSLPLRKHIIDGEVTGKDWAQTMTLFRSSKADVNDKLKRYGRYKIFDLVNPHKLDEPFRDRRERLEEVFAKHSHPMVMLTKSEQVQSYDEFVELHNFHLASGCDGSIIKLTASPYEFKRSGYWLKVKPQKRWTV